MFENIAGYKEEKQELEKLCNLLKRKDEITSNGGFIPKGVLLRGPNGVGKTQLAKEFIKESGYNCVEVSYDDFDERAENTKSFKETLEKAFKDAAKKKPCIVFVDEVDKLVGRSFFSMDGEGDRSNSLLAIINKHLDDETFVFLVGNRRLTLDPSLTRSGRIDKTINIENPNIDERKEILNFYLKDKVTDSIDVDEFAKLIEQASGADIKTIVNNALLMRISDNKPAITNDYLTSAYFDLLFQHVKKDDSQTIEKDRVIAIHEAGHACLSIILKNEIPIISSIQRRENIRGFVSNSHNDKELKLLKEYYNDVVVALGGREAEKLFYGDYFEGSCSDIAKAKDMCDSLVRIHGFVGIDSICSGLITPHEFYSPSEDPISNSTLEKVENNTSQLLVEATSIASSLIREHKDLILMVADALLKERVLPSLRLSEVVMDYEESHNVKVYKPNTAKYVFLKDGYTQQEQAASNIDAMAK